MHGDALPVRAVDFIAEKSLPEPLFNPYEWGGYLIWRLYPDYQVFIDSRTLDDGAYADYLPDADGELQRMRLGDGVHMTPAGGDRMFGPVLEAVLRARIQAAEVQASETDAPADP